MSLSTFFIAVPITILVLVFIRYYWQVIALVGSLLYALWTVTWISFLCTFIWASFVTRSADKWWITYAYFFITFTGMVIVAYLILSDVVSIIGSTIKNLFK